MELYLISILLASIFIIPFALKTFSPYVWMDFLYFGDLLRILVTYGARRRRRPLFFVLDRFLEQTVACPDKLFIAFGDERHTYADADRKSNKIARALQSQAGYTSGDTVALFMGNEPTFVFTWLALAKLGSPVALLNYNIRTKSLLHCFNCCKAKVLVAASDLKEAVEDVLPSLIEQGVVVLLMTKHCDTSGIQSFLDKVEEAPDSPLPRSLRSHLSFKSPAVYIYTSGTTGLPKAAVITHLQSLKAAAGFWAFGGTEDDVVYIPLPLYHSAASLIGIGGTIELGATCVLKKKFSASQFWNDCRQHDVTIFQYIGELCRYLCNQPKTEMDQDHKVRMGVGNGLRQDVWREFLSRFGNIKMCEVYGSTEGNLCFMNHIGKIGTVGRSNLFYRLLFKYDLVKYDMIKDEVVKDQQGFCQRVNRGETGLLLSKVSSISPFFGYAGSKQLTEKKLMKNVFVKGDAYFNTGDLMAEDQEGFICFRDRVGDTFRWKGENVATTEVTETLGLVDFIQEVNVFGVEVPGHEGRAGMAALIVRPGLTFDGKKLFEHSVRDLPAYARPIFIRLQEVMEMTSTFKQQKFQLVQSGFNPSTISDPLYVLDYRQKSYVPLTEQLYQSIVSGEHKL